MTTTIMTKFAQVYADAVDHEAPLEDGERFPGQNKRELEWKSEHRIPLAEAAEAYAQIDGNYNEFQPTMLADLLAEFPDQGIEVTPAREYSVAVYLHARPGLRRQVRKFVEDNWLADEVDWKEADTLRVWWD